jgi:CHAT domain-containing protein/tetratricopeptide (TPR) repeat protein
MRKTGLVYLACAFSLVASGIPLRAEAGATPMEEARQAFVEADYPKALEKYQGLLEDAKRSGEMRTVVDCLIELGGVYRQLSQYRKALEHLENALELSMELKYHARSARALTVAGRVYQDLGQYEEALGHHRRALAIRRNINNNKVGDDYLGIGMVHRYLGQYPKAIEHLEKAIELYRREEFRRSEATALSETGTVYRLMGQPERALTYHEQALAISKELKFRVQEQYDLINIGIAYLALGESSKALQYFEQALVIGRDIQNRKGEGVSLLNIGDTLNRMGEYDKAQEALNRCLKIFEDLGTAEFVWRAEHCLALINKKQGRHEEALVFYERAIDTIEGLRSRLSEGGRASFMENKLRVYDQLIELLMNLHGKDPSKGFDRRSFEIFERKQGRIFLEAMGRSGAKHFAWLPRNLRDKESNLEEELAECERSLAEERSSPSGDRQKESIESLVKRIGQAKAAQKAFEEVIKRDYPDYHALKHPKPASVPELQQKVLRPGELLLVYGVTSKSTALWIVGREQFELFTIPIDEEKLGIEVRDFRDGIQVVLDALQRKQPEFLIRNIIQDSMERMCLKGRDLHDVLLPQGALKAVSNAGTLYFIPSGSLYVLPFEALVPSLTTEGHNPRFLIENHPVAYLSSASLLRTLREAVSRKREKPHYPLIAFANPVYGGRRQSAAGDARSQTLSQESMHSEEDAHEMSVRSIAIQELMGGTFVELPETEDEVKEIMNLLAAPQESAPLQLRDAASRSKVMDLSESDKLKDYRYLVFSCHGVLPEEVDSVLQPALVLSHPDPQSRGDGFLTMADVFRLRLNADFVSLSACNTGMGKIVKGEGVIGLTRAFMYAGTPALMVNLWSVESQSAKRLNTGFYRYLTEGENRAQALRLSKLHFIHNEKEDLLRHPFFWAPSVIFGDGD